MKLWSIFTLFFTFLFGFSQKGDLPVWENNYFEYTQNTIGKKFQNIVSLAIAEDGSLFTQTFSKPIYEVSAYGFNKFIDNDDLYSGFFKIHTFPNSQIILFDRDVVIKKKDNKIVKPFNFNTNIEVGEKAYFYHSKIYFSIYIPSKDCTLFYSYDGEKLELLHKVTKKVVGLVMIQNQVFLKEKDEENHKTIIYDFLNKIDTPIKVYPFISVEFIYYAGFDSVYYDGENEMIHYKNGISKKLFNPKQRQFPVLCFYNMNVGKSNNFYDFRDNFSLQIQLSNYETTLANAYSKESASLYISTNNKIIRAFKYIRKYPRVFGKNNSNNIFCLSQTNNGKIWVGNFDGKIAVIDDDKITENTQFQYPIMNGGISVGNKNLINSDYNNGLYLFSDINTYKKINDTIKSFQNCISKNKVFYSATLGNGLMYKPLKDLEDPSIPWKFINKKNGLQLKHVNSVTEDQFGNIWMGSTLKGIAAYQPKTGKIYNWVVNKNEIGYGIVTIKADTFGNVWFGNTNGELIYWNGKNKNDFRKENFIKINHPLLKKGEESIKFLHQWKNWLIIGRDDKILLLDLKTWNDQKQLKIRYLTLQESNLSATTERNTVLTDNKDNSIWFATSDMLYKWDIEHWLKLPIYKVVPKMSIRKGDTKSFRKPNETSVFQPTDNSFDIEVEYQTKDNLPRFIQSRLIQNNKIIAFNELKTENKISFKNLSSGNYTFVVEVCQTDGTFESFEFPIEIKQFVWEKWWFWLLISLVPAGFILYYINSKKLEEKNKNEITQLNVNTLSSHFRPHFMLNTLNSLGADMYDKPHAERIISRLGEITNLMYQYSQKKQFCTQFTTEWRLIEITIEIQKSIFLKDLQFEVKNREIIPQNYKVPMGILQIGIENALLHGLRHRKKSPHSLEVIFSEIDGYYIVDIIDNGVGRKKSATINDFRKNGTGLKNINEIIKIINSKIKNAISIQFIDHVFDDDEYPGTQLKIKLLKHIDYDKFNV